MQIQIQIQIQILMQIQIQQIHQKSAIEIFQDRRCKKSAIHKSRSFFISNFMQYYSHTQARAKLPKKRRRVVNVDLPQAAQNKGRGRGPAARGGKAGLGQKMGE